MKNMICFMMVAMVSFLGFEAYSGRIPSAPIDLQIGEVSRIFKANVNGKPAEVIAYKGIHYLRFAQQGEARIQIDLLQQLDDMKISPRLFFRKIKKQVQFVLQKPGYHVLSSEQGEMLFILSDQSLSLSQSEKKNIINIADYNVDLTGKKSSTEKIQQAINEASAKGKILYFGPGIYKTGTLTVGSNTNIYLAEGSLIDGSTNPADYPVDKGFIEPNELTSKNYSDNGEQMTFSRLLLIDNANHVKIWGSGILNGNGAEIRRTGKPTNLIRIRNSKNVLIEGICLFDPAAWNTHILYSDSVTIKNVKIINDPNVKNTDGIDPDASKHVLIKDCFAYCSDDNIAIKSSNNSNLLKDCENIMVEGCVFLTRKSALKVGTETKAAYLRNITFQNNWVVQADRGLVLYCFDGASFQNIKFINNYFEYPYKDNEQKAIHFVIKNRSGRGVIDNVLIKNCFFSKRFHSNIEINGLDEAHTISNVTFQNIAILGNKATSIDDLHIKSNAFVNNLKLIN